MKKTLYLLGNVTDMSEQTAREYRKAKGELKRAGYRCSKATRYMSVAFSERLYEKRAAQSIREMLAYDKTEGHAKYAGVALLDGWENDAKTVAHVSICRTLGIPCERWEEWVNDTEDEKGAYVVEIEEKLCRRYIVRATDANEARQKIVDAYRAENIILDADDYLDTQYSCQEATAEDLEIYPKFNS